MLTQSLIPKQSRSSIILRASETKQQLFICKNKACRKQGALEIIKLLKNIPMDTVSIEETGCMGNCGDGPNVAVPDGQIIMKVDTQKACDILDAYYGVKIEPSIVEVLELKRLGNEHIQFNEPKKAIEVYTMAIERGCDTLMHVLYANRAAANIMCKQFEQAMADARQAIKISPPGYANGYVRLAEAQARQQDFHAALDTLQQAAVAVPEFGATASFKAQVQVFQEKLDKAQGTPVAA